MSNELYRRYSLDLTFWLPGPVANWSWMMAWTFCALYQHKSQAIRWQAYTPAVL